MKVFGLFRKFGVFGKGELIEPLYLDEGFAFSQMHSRNLTSPPMYYYFIKEIEIDETKNQRILCAKREDCII